MITNKRCFTKPERKELRRLAGLAYERELAKALELLGKKFGQWEKKKITAFKLNDFIHKFHNGTARDLWSFYTGGDSVMIVAHALAKGIILKTEVSPAILEKLIR